MQRKAAHIHEAGRVVLEMYPQSVMRIQDKSFEKNLETFIHDSCLRGKGSFGCRVPYILNPFKLGSGAPISRNARGKMAAPCWYAWVPFLCAALQPAGLLGLLLEEKVITCLERVGNSSSEGTW